MFKFYIDGTQYNDPTNWAEFSETIEFDKDLKLFLFKYQQKLDFTGDAYQYLYNKRNVSGLCYIATIEVKKQCSSGGEFITCFTGKIFVSDCAFHINKCLVECSVVDNNYAEVIFNNKSIKVQLELEKSKNGVTMPGGAVGIDCDYYLNVDCILRCTVWNMFDPSDGTLIGGQDLRIYFLHDVFTYLVYWLSDGEVGFVSDYLNYNTPITTDAEKVRQLVLTKGKNIRLYGQNKQESPVLSFQQLFEALNKVYPVVISTEYDNTGKAFIRIEDEAYYRSSPSSITLNNLPDVTEKLDNSLLYGAIKIGGQSAEYSSVLHSYPPTEQLTFAEEAYYLRGGCNTSEEKNLFNEFVFDTNIIQEIFITDPSNTTWDENLFFLEVDPNEAQPASAVYDAIATVNYSTPVMPYSYHYNDRLQNLYISERASFHADVYQGYDLLSATPEPVEVAAFDSSNYYANVVSFDWALNEADYQAMRSDPQKSILWNINGTSNRRGWVKRTTRTFETSQMQWELITNIQNSQ